MTEQEAFEAIKEACLSKGGKLLLEDITAAKEASDTIKVMPLVENGVVLVSQTDMMLKQQGWVSGVEFVIGLMQHYINEQYEGEE
jgi:hypothetical protein